MMVRDLVSVLDEIAPIRYAEPWDNVGLLIGDAEATVSRVLLTIDYTPAVAREAIDGGYEMVVSYHPPLFEPIRRLTADHPLFETVRRGIAIHSPHTALDVAPGGTNDVLADAIELSERAPLRRATTADSEVKLTTFVPRDQVEAVSRSLFAAGAGRIGNYHSCSFRLAGQGTFFGQEGTNPAVGQKGRIETVDEIRLEMVAPFERLDAIVAALRAAHPYEEPAFDLLRLAPSPKAIGAGRIGVVSAKVGVANSDGGAADDARNALVTTRTTAPIERAEVIARAGRALGLEHLLVAGPTAGTVKRAAVCAGSCGDLLDVAISAGAELLLTGEVKHHDALRAARAGMTVVATLHSNSERKTLAWLAKEIERLAPGVSAVPSAKDRDPFTIVSASHA